MRGVPSRRARHSPRRRRPGGCNPTVGPDDPQGEYGRYRRAPPVLGEHMNDVLAQLLGMDDYALHRLRERKVI